MCAVDEILTWQIHVFGEVPKLCQKYNERLRSAFPLAPVCEAFRHEKLYIYLKAAVIP